MNAEIISVGTELLLGDIVNSNSQFLSRELAAYGVDTLYQSTVGDNRERLHQAIELALTRCDLVILTGGLGPTEDDLTRETVAQCLGLSLVLDEESDRRIRAYFERTGKEYTDNNQKQALLPKGCTVFPNDHGTAPGCAIEQDAHHIVLLPGPPKEMAPMFYEYVAPYLARCSGGTIHSHTVGVFGIPEAAVDERLHDLMEGNNPTVAPYAKDGEVVLRITAKADTVEQANALCNPIIADIRERLGNAVYGVDAGGLANRVVSLLTEKERKIATAESCTAGLLSGRLTEVPGVSSVFECGIAAYSKEIKHQMLGVPESILEERGAVSPETAGAMAVGARRVGGADIGIGITGVAGPDSSEGKAVGTVYVALADEKRVWVKKVFAGHCDEDREYIRHMATLYALDMSRRYLEALPGVMAGGQSLEQMQQEVRAMTEEQNTAAKKRRRRSRLLCWLAAIAAALLVLAPWAYVYAYIPYLNQKNYDELYQIYTQAEVETEGWYPNGILTQFMTLYRNNDDVRGWVSVEGTRINYPVVLEPSPGYYEQRDFHEDASLYGVPHLKTGTQVDQASMKRSLTIYGNNPENGQMFSQLADYTELSFLKQHSTIEMNTIYQEGEYKIFAVILVDDTDENELNYARTAFEDEEEFLYHVAQLRTRSLFDTPVDIVEGDGLLLLTTPIDYGYEGARIVVAARRVRAGEDRENDLSKARVNRSAKMPKGWVQTNGGGAAATATKTTVDTTAATTEMTTTEATTTAQTTTTAVVTTTTATTTTKSKTTTTKTTVTTKADEGDELVGETTATETTVVPTTQVVTKPPAGSTPVPVVPSTGTVQGTISEYDFMSYIAVKNDGAFSGFAADDDGILRPKTKEQLQLLIAGIVKSELGSASTMVNSTEAQKAQAVASYSYLLHYNTHTGVYPSNVSAINLTNKWDKMIYEAVGDVVGVKLVDTSQSAIPSMTLQTVYSASTGGYSASSNRVWTGTLAYAKSVVSKYDDAITNAKYGGKKFVSTVTISRDDLYAKVKKWFQNNVQNRYPNYTMPEEQFTTAAGQTPLRALSYDGDGSAGTGDAWNYVFHTNFHYVDNKGNQKPLTGYNIRNALGLRSHAFRVSYDEATQTVTITTQGWGHGVGLSQMGAVGYANEAGWTYIQILRHYYSVTDTSAHQLVMPVW
ncbi:MAG: competence/damage-inducible protein A [Clostridia bacterium]|nr:competence/damage-inducible protein A [Clostridia bacterium]